ncbi:MAG: putative type transport system permease protein [Bacillales bacterium]|jgi:ABC-2 type transport system permease protein|nr:putative type transport system permease protein [Bacillales bacterium]
MNIFIHELRFNRKSVLIWSFSLLAFLVFMMSMLPGIAKDGKSLLDMVKNYPPEMMKALGVNVTSLITTLGFFTYLMNYALLIGAIQAMNLGLSLISKENRMKTADFLLTKPVKRSDVYVAKFCSGIVSLIFTNILFVSMSALICTIFKSDDFSMKALILMAFSLFFVQICFYSMGFMISTILKKIKSVVSVSMGIVFSFFIVGILGAIIGDDKIRYISPFKYFDYTYIVKNEGYEWGFLLLALILSAAFTAVGFVIYQKKDIPSV